MLRIIRNWEYRDYLRFFNGLRQYGIPIARNYMALQWQGAYAETEGTIIYFVARKIDNGNHVIESYDLGTDLIKYENGQYLYDNTKLYDGILPDGTYFFEFNDGEETYWSQAFCVKARDELALTSSIDYCSSESYISDLNISIPDQIIIKRFEDGELFEFEN